MVKLLMSWSGPKLLKPTSRFTFCLMAFELGLVLLRWFNLQDTGFLCGWSLYWGYFEQRDVYSGIVII